MSKELAKTYDPKAIEEKLYENGVRINIFMPRLTGAGSRLRRLCRLRTSQENSTWGMPLITRCRTS